MCDILKETYEAEEVVIMDYYPMIEKWELYFDKIYGYDNRYNVAKAFADYWEDANVRELEIPGKCMLGGKVFGHEGYPDGDLIFTSSVKTIKRVEHDEQNGVPHDLMCATTLSGNKYYFYSDGHNAYMFQMLGDLIHTGKLDQRRYYYLRRELHNLGLI